MRSLCASCRKQAALRPIQVDVTSRYHARLVFRVRLCGPCTAALCDQLDLEGANAVLGLRQQPRIPSF